MQQTVIKKYCDIALDKGNFSSYAAIARFIGIAPPSLTMFRNGTATASENTVILLARAAGEEELDVMAEYKIEQAKSENVVEFWNGMRNTAAALLLFTIVLQGSITQNIFGTEDVKSSLDDIPCLYIM